MTGTGEQVGGGDQAVGVEPFAAGGVEGEVGGGGGECLVQGGVLKSDTADDDVHSDGEGQDMRIHLKIGLEELGAVGEGLHHADEGRGLGSERKLVHLLLCEDRTGGGAEAGLQDGRAGLQRLEVEAHAAGGGLLDADFEQRGVVGGEVNAAGRAVDQHFLLAAEADLAGDGAL